MSDAVAPVGNAPGRGRLGPLVADFDARADAWLEWCRGNPILDRLFTAATDAGEFSAIWHVCSLGRGLVRNRPDQVVALGLGIAAESLIVNQGVKRVFNRRRPTDEGDERFAIRRPLTSSFPSGHASAATFAAITLTRWDGRRWAPVWGTIAASVAISRPYVRIHHASDIIGGIVAGAALAEVARRVFIRCGVE